MASIPSRICNVFSSIANMTDVLEKTAKLVIPSIELTLFTNVISNQSVTTSLTLIRYEFKQFTHLMGALDVINQLALWTVGTFDKDGNQLDKSYAAQLWEKGINAKLVSKAFLLVGKVAETLIGFSHWNLIDLGALSAATIGRIPYFGQTLHTLAANASFPVLGLVKDSLMLASTIASSVNTLPASIDALANYGSRRQKIEDKIAYWTALKNLDMDGRLQLAHQKSLKAYGTQAELDRWNGFFLGASGIQPGGSHLGDQKIQQAIDYKVRKWTEIHKENLPKSWWKKQIAAINDIAKFVIITASLICTLAAFVAPPIVFIALGLACGLIGATKAYYDADPNNHEKDKEKFKQEFLPA